MTFILYCAISLGFFIVVEIQQISLMIAYENDQNNSLRIISKSITNNCTLGPKVNNSVCQCYETLFFINYIVAIS